MKAPQRLVDDNALFGKLVAADNREEPQPEVLDDLLRKLPSPEKAAPARAPSRLQKAIAVAVVGGCVLTSVALFGRAQIDRPPTEASPSVSIAPPLAPPPPPREVPPAREERSGSAVPTVSVDDLPSARPPASTRTETPAPSGRREIELIIAAREALTRLEADRCLAAVGAYEAEFPSGQFTLEAKVMRVEATAARGDHARARVLARDFLAKNPSSLYDDRVRSLLDSPEAR